LHESGPLISSFYLKCKGLKSGSGMHPQMDKIVRVAGRTKVQKMEKGTCHETRSVFASNSNDRLLKNYEWNKHSPPTHTPYEISSGFFILERTYARGRFNMNPVMKQP
jgi:hypothetical protein